MTFDIGVTGSRNGLTAAQYIVAVQLLSGLAENEPLRLHHGDCIGVDAAIHVLALAGGYAIKVHPPDNDKHRAFCTQRVASPLIEEAAPLPYLERNQAIVNESEALIAFPSGPEAKRSGTWATVRYARSKDRLMVVVYPDGLCDEENIGEH